MNSRPLAFHLLAKPTGATCNLDCKYCFFLSKEMLYPGDRFRMSDQLLETYIRQLLEAQPADEVNVAWQGGEPTLMGLDFFKRSIEYVEKYRKPGQRILHTMQTNGTLLNDEWCAFFKEHNFLVGLSVDGPKEMHDAYRVNKGGEGSFDQVMRALGNAAPARRGGQYPVYHSRRERRSSARSLPILSRRVAGRLTCSSSQLWNGPLRTYCRLPTWAGASGPVRTGPCTRSTARWSPSGRSAPNSSAAS